MVDGVKIKNFGPIRDLDWQRLGKINLIIGENGAGKTFLLKALYCSLRALEDFKRGNDPRSINDILCDKLYWTYQADKIGDLVSKGAGEQLSCLLKVGDRHFSYKFGKDTVKNIVRVEHDGLGREERSMFLPAKEVLSLYRLILDSRDQDHLFGFDDTYLDLVRALRAPTRQGRNFPEFAESRGVLEAMLGGRVEYDENAKVWQFKKGNQKFSIGVTAEGVKKIAILDTLLGNRYIRPQSVIFFDEPESALHPEAISKLIDIIATLSERGIQFFLASHSYFVINKLFLIARQKKMSIPMLSITGDKWIQDDLINGMPDNPIIDETIRLYREEVEINLS
ncbi:MAG: ATP-binding protein [Alphaproteobacteria bacterium]|nr:ATP-binding protein [Alphaproteobacteria bacterium]